MDAHDTRRDGLGNLLGGNDDPTSGSTGSSGSESGPNEDPFGGVASAFSSMIDGGAATTSTSSSSSITTAQKSSSSSTSTPSASTPSTTSSSVSTPNSIPTPTPTLVPIPIPTPTPASSASLIVLTSTSGTSVVYVTSTASSSASATAAPQSFLQNKPLEGGVFALVGIVIVIMIFVVVTYTIRRRRRSRLENDITDPITFGPVVIEHYGDEEKGTNTFEKSRLSGSSSGHGHGFGYGPQLAYAPPAVPQYGYYSSQGYEQQAAAYYVPPTQGSIYNLNGAVNAGDAANTSGAANMGGGVDSGGAADTAGSVSTGGANLTRKYSNRKPVPPLLPNPVYDPSQSPVLPSHYYMQNQDVPISPISQSMNLSAPPGDLTTPAPPDDLEDDPYTGMLEVVDH